MAHTHDVYDTGKHFEINGISRFIKETSATKLVLVQGDHDSEVITFQMPRYIDGHDTLLCNKIRVHYINLDTKTNDKSADIYEVTDLTLCEECKDVLTFTWTIEAPATKYSGTLSFLVKFECTEGENVLYQWNTAKYVSVNVLAGIDNSEEFVDKYSNVLEEWYNEITKGAESIEELNQQAIAEIELAKEDAKEDIESKADSTMAAMTQHASNTYEEFVSDVNKKAEETLESIPDDYTALAEEVNELSEHIADLESVVFDEIVTQEDIIALQGITFTLADNHTIWSKPEFDTTGKVSIMSVPDYSYRALNEPIKVESGKTYIFKGLYGDEYTHGQLMFVDENLENGTSKGITSDSFEWTVPDGRCYALITINSFFANLDNIKIIGECVSKVQKSYKPLINKKIINFGDSIFGQARAPYDVSTKLAELTGATVYNCGFGGCQMGEHAQAKWNSFSMYKLAEAIASGNWSEQEESAIQSGIPSYFAETVALLKSIDFSTIDIITISYGTNDFGNGLKPSSTVEAFTNVAYSLKYSIKTILSAYPHIKIFVCTPTYRVWLNSKNEFDYDSNTAKNTSWVDSKEYSFIEFVTAILETAKAMQTPIIDNYYELGINQYNWKHYFPTTDGTHHNQNGRNRIAENMAKNMW